MTCVTAETCIDVKDGVCTEESPMDCVCEGGRMYCTQPDECVNFAPCVSVGPVEAIRYEDHLPPRSTGFVAVASEFFDDAVTGRDPPGGLAPEFRTDRDRPGLASVIGERACDEHWSENRWIPAFAGMTEEGVPGCAVRTIIPASAE